MSRIDHAEASRNAAFHDKRLWDLCQKRDRGGAAILEFQNFMVAETGGVVVSASDYPSARRSVPLGLRTL